VAESLEESVDRVGQKIDLILRDDGTAQRIEGYFKPAEGYAGVFFNILSPTEPNVLTQAA
jgi:hypothetical protein